MNSVIKQDGVSEGRAGSYPAPFSLESFKSDIIEVYVHYIRSIGRMIDCEKAIHKQVAWGLTGQPPSELSEFLFDPDYKAADLGLRYEHIRESLFAQCMESLYELAFNGRIDPMAEAIEYESSYMWIADLAMDALHGNMSEQWDSYGGMIKEEATNCVLVVETANARCILENGKYFSHRSNGKGGEDLSDDSLTIRQMALLSGMEEMSIRSAANPKRASPLKTYTNENGSTRIARDVAKEWLMLKARYIPLTHYSNSTELNLSKQKFTTYLDLVSALEARSIVMASRIGYDVIKKNLEDIGINNHQTLAFDKNFISMHSCDFLNEPLIAALANLLELPQELLMLRCKQTAANEQLAEIERELRKLVSAI